MALAPVGQAWPQAAATSSYAYDNVGRLKKLEQSNGASITYGYDLAGNRTQVTSVKAPNRAPVAAQDAATTLIGQAVTLNPLANDSDPDGETVSIVSVGQPAQGTATLGAGGVVTFTPAAGYHGVQTFSYVITDNAADNPLTATGTIAVTVQNRAPVAADDTAVTVTNAAATISPLGNDSDPDGDALTITAVTNGAHGTAAISGSTIVYTPQAGYAGPDSFGYTVTDGRGATASATVTVTVQNRAPAAAADTVSTPKNTPVTFNPRVNDSDPDGDALTITAIPQQPTQGTASFNATSVTYTPPSGYVGTTSFTYRVSDGKDGLATATVTATVYNRAPVAGDDTVSAGPATAVVFDPRGNDSDPDGDALTITAVTTPGKGTASFTATSVTYTPSVGASGSDSFSYTVSDGAASATAVVTVTIAANQAPVAVADTVTTFTNTAVTFNPRANDSDPNGDPLTITAVTTPSQGTATHNGSTITYTPPAGYYGTVGFSYTISDGKGGTATASVGVTVQNRAPVAVNDTTSTPANTPKNFDPRANDSDPDRDSLTVVSATGASNGTLQVFSTYVRYTPNTGYNGSDSFTYTVSDGKGGQASATVTISVTNTAPVAVNDTLFTVNDTPAGLDPRTNDSDANGDPLTVTAVTQGAHGSVVFSGGSVTYTPVTGYVGNDSFTYTISDGKGGTATATVSVEVSFYDPGGDCDPRREYCEIN